MKKIFIIGFSDKGIKTNDTYFDMKEAPAKRGRGL